MTASASEGTTRRYASPARSKVCSISASLVPGNTLCRGVPASSLQPGAGVRTGAVASPSARLRLQCLRAGQGLGIGASFNNKQYNSHTCLNCVVQGPIRIISSCYIRLDLDQGLQ